MAGTEQIRALRRTSLRWVPPTRRPGRAPPVRGRTAIGQHFTAVLTERRSMELVMVAITDHHAAVHFRATPADGASREVIDTMTFNEQAMNTSMQAYASEGT